MPSSVLSPVLAVGAVLLVTYFFPKYICWRNRMVKLNAIPTMGNSGLFSSYISAQRYKDHALEIIQEGYCKYPGGAFKIPLLDRWDVIVSGEKMIDDIRKASPLDLSFIAAFSEDMQTDYTMGKVVRVNTYHVPVVRSPLTRALPARFHDLRDEVVASFADFVPAKESEWMKVPMLSTIMQIVSRTSNRYFVGLPLCMSFACHSSIPIDVKTKAGTRTTSRNLNITFTVDAVIGGTTLQRYPGFLKPIVSQFLTNVPASLARAEGHLGPLIRERLAKEKEHGTSDWPDKPNDLVTWLLEEVGERNENIVSDIVHRVLLVNFAAIHTTSMTFTNSIYYLAAYPQIAEPLREEVSAAIEELGWTKAAMSKMVKLDSFLKETQWLSGVNGVGMTRMALRDFTFSDGTVVPAGTIVAVASQALHYDGAYYEDPETFKPFRFSNLREQEGESLKHQMAAVDPAFVVFGGGRPMCPGRFFAVNELKALMGHVLLTYDVEFENNKGIPPPSWHGVAYSPNRSAEVMFRKRAV
ncbi:cytochrome P450 [Rhodocollybia butyracea]|uniref:Cytochrome P450 n=1 Tax=Rhodocollybia butyracea TaxID=206335 RepID=A0A9P5PJZ7_9AGAR|nr:cytochrome P450 [Rhodocollybia butyracea]